MIIADKCDHNDYDHDQCNHDKFDKCNHNQYGKCNHDLTHINHEHANDKCDDDELPHGDHDHEIDDYNKCYHDYHNCDYNNDMSGLIMTHHELTHIHHDSDINKYDTDDLKNHDHES